MLRPMTLCRGVIFVKWAQTVVQYFIQGTKGTVTALSITQ